MGTDLRDASLVAVIEPDGSVSRAIAKIIRTAGLSEEVFASAEEFVRSKQLANTGCLVVDVHCRA